MLLLLLRHARLAFIKGLAAAPTDTSQRQRIAQYWLGSYGLQLPPSYPFMVGVAAHPEAEAAQLQVKEAWAPATNLFA